MDYPAIITSISIMLPVVGRLQHSPVGVLTVCLLTCQGSCDSTLIQRDSFSGIIEGFQGDHVVGAGLWCRTQRDTLISEGSETSLPFLLLAATCFQDIPEVGLLIMGHYLCKHVYIWINMWHPWRRGRIAMQDAGGGACSLHVVSNPASVTQTGAELPRRRRHMN